MFSKKEKPVTISEDGFTVEMTESAPCQRSLSVTVGVEAYEPIRNGVVKQFQKESTIKGFRKGKAPLAIVEKNYAMNIQQETLERATQQAFDTAAKVHELKPVGPFEISDSDFSDDKGLTLKATVDIQPEFELGEYKGIKLERKAIEITEEDKDQACLLYTSPSPRDA